MKEINIGNLRENLVKIISKDWMLVTAGTIDSYNMMTANWGTAGFIWGHDIMEIFVRRERFTREFIDREGRFTLSFFDGEMNKALEYMGMHSGRDINKMNYAPLQPEELPTGQITFCGARLVVECEVIYHDTLSPNAFTNPDIYARWYEQETGGLHERYYGKVVRVWTDDK